MSLALVGYVHKVMIRKDHIEDMNDLLFMLRNARRGRVNGSSKGGPNHNFVSGGWAGEKVRRALREGIP